MFSMLLLSVAIAFPAPTPCSQLKFLTLPGTTVTVAELVPPGPFRAPNAAPAPGLRGQPAEQPVGPVLAAHCRVAATLKPSSDSTIDIEVWMPAENWNRKFQAVGNGGWAGSISYNAMVSALREGYATASTDTGHKGGDASFALGHPEKLVDFAYRSVHELTVTSKAIIAAFYDRGPRFSYWNGCSTGGRQALMEAQRYPEDFDGIIAGAPANYRTNQGLWGMSLGVAALKDKESLVPAAKLAGLNKAVLGACDAADGLKDGLLADPRQCRFDPSALLCSNGDAPDCLTAQQVETVRKVYGPLKTKSGETIFPGMAMGSELQWTGLIGGPDPLGLALTGFRYVVHGDPNWDWRTFDLESDRALMEKTMGYSNAIDPNLQAFKARGGKLLMYHGWNDQLIPPENSINYYSSVLAKMGSGQSDWLRLFLAPGMQHCNGGPGPSQVNWVGALERWRESGVAPDQILAGRVTNNRIDMTRPLCPYPQIARYTGVGSTNDAENFVCKAP